MGRRFKRRAFMGRVGQLVPTEDAAVVTDWSQVRQSTVDPAFAGFGQASVDTPFQLPYGPQGSPDTTTGTPVTTDADGLPVVTVQSGPVQTPIWPLLIALGVIGYALFYGGKHA